MRKMKDSGVKWIGKIPETWKLERLQWCLQEINERNDPIKTTQILSLTNKLGVLPYEDKGNQGNKAKEDLTEYKIAYDNTLIVNSMNVIIGSVGISHYAGCVSPVYYVFRETEKADLRFVNYIFQTHGFQKELRKYANGILEIRLRISSGDLFKRPIPLPSLEEQKQIADYLDWQCSEVDAVLEKTRSSIEEYKHLKQAVITQAVTKGVRGDRPMKESGIEWAGSIPKEWEIIKLKHLGHAQNGLTYTPANMCDKSDGILVIRSSNIQNGILDFNDCVYVNSDVPDDLALHSGDIIICSRNGSKKLVGKSAIVERDIVATYGAFMMVFRSNIQSKKYVYWLLNSDLFNYHLNMFSTVTINQLTGGNLNNMLVPFCPNQDEQKEVAAYLDEKCAEIDALIAQKEQLLTELENYKKSLIYEYITGKKSCF